MCVCVTTAVPLFGESFPCEVDVLKKNEEFDAFTTGARDEGKALQICESKWRVVKVF